LRFVRYCALVVFFFNLPVPFYWFILHPFGRFWSRRIPTAFRVAGYDSWGAGLIFIVLLRRHLLAATAPSILVVIVAFALFALDFLFLRAALQDLGGLKLVGHAELTGRAELITEGLYKRMRHPRYTGMILGVIGACLLAGAEFTWFTGALWFLCTMMCIVLEEREMRRRFGAAYEAYSRATPRFLPKLFS
jgi:protein-S-isoprenylcysteine O-methyltransferase Ste14